MSDPMPPLKFVPRLESRIWGGRNLADLGKDLPEGEPIGESWELYDLPPGAVKDQDGWTSGVVTGGPHDRRTLHELMSDQGTRQQILGTAAPADTGHGPQFPLLVKFLDAQKDLSVQVHPTADYAAANPGAHLKNEAWHVMRADEGARLLKGVKAGVTAERFRAAIDDGSVEDLLVALPAKVGETHYLPSGTVHALGAGMTVAEVQTPSDTTYRVYDFDRVDDKTGRKRELHVKQAMEVIDFASAGTDPHPPVPDGERLVVDCPQFETVRRQAKAGQTVPLPGTRCSVLVFLAGEGTVLVDGAEDCPFERGETVLVPADAEGPLLRADADCDWLETTFPTA